MANMTHCMFTNTLENLRQCYEAMASSDDLKLSKAEHKAMLALITMCGEIHLDFEELYFDDSQTDS